MLSAKGLLTVEGTFPPTTERTATTIAGTITIINPGPPLSGDTSPMADVYLAQDGKVVATPMVKDQLAQQIDLAEGASKDFPATGTLQSCTNGEPLPTGTYDVFTVVTITGGDNTLIATGGPWQVTIT